MIEAGQIWRLDGKNISQSFVALYKERRAILHRGKLYRLHHADESRYGQLVVGDKYAFATQTRFTKNYNVAPVRLSNLEPDDLYKITLPRPWPKKAATYLVDPEIWENGMTLSGRALVERGLALPLARPETAWLIALEKVPS